MKKSKKSENIWRKIAVLEYAMGRKDRTILVTDMIHSLDGNKTVPASFSIRSDNAKYTYLRNTLLSLSENGIFSKVRMPGKGKRIVDAFVLEKPPTESILKNLYRLYTEAAE